jgi:uncharacterized protein (TIGR02118 family)
MLVIKRVSLVTRKAGMPVEEFQVYWREVHAPLALRVPGLRRYIQSHTLMETYDAPDPPVCDGIVETWWDSVEASEQARKTPEREAVDADQPNFMGGSKGLITTEIPILDAFPSGKGRQSMVKRVAMLYRKEGVSVEAFQKYWREVHGPAVISGPHAMRQYVQTHVLPETYTSTNPPTCDGLAEIWYESLEAYQNRPGGANTPRDPRWKDYCRGQDQIWTREMALLD